MNADEIVRYVQSLPGVETQDKDGDQFFFIGADRRMPFVTLVTADRHDTASDLTREGIFRLNIGISKMTYTARFGEPPPFSKDNHPADTGFDYTATNTLMPHPIYAAMYWVCVLTPADALFSETVRPLIDEAHRLARERGGRAAD